MVWTSGGWGGVGGGKCMYLTKNPFPLGQDMFILIDKEI